MANLVKNRNAIVFKISGKVRGYGFVTHSKNPLILERVFILLSFETLLASFLGRAVRVPGSE